MIDDEFRNYMKMAYAIGERKHISEKNSEKKVSRKKSEAFIRF